MNMIITLIFFIPIILTSLLLSFYSISRTTGRTKFARIEKYALLLVLYAIYEYFILSFTYTFVGFYCFEYTLAIFISYYCLPKEGKYLFLITPLLLMAYYSFYNFDYSGSEIRIILIGIIHFIVFSVLQSMEINQKRWVQIIFLLMIDMVISLGSDSAAISIEGRNIRIDEEVLVFLGSLVVVFLYRRFHTVQLQDIKAMNDAIKKSQIDSLTGAHNFSGFTKLLENFPMNTSIVTVAMIDLDYFKKVNDTYGHIEGNNLLISLVRMIRNYMNSQLNEEEYYIFRFGGEEFCLVFFNLDSKKVKNLLDDFRMSFVTYYDSVDDYDKVQVSFSVGISSKVIDGDKEVVHIALEEADKALYKAKNNGRNQVIIYKDDEQKNEQLNLLSFLKVNNNEKK
ncbi:GGDEF domain-containing protein [Floricoccus penangensis]|uniref:GGDEF domain-containing protein n=1 Tax=Floricoccus penangensis TaxID=1859475 RepID=UPI00204167C4|nr:GGDEF domain-containing protein [Floricoccus penangensis]URZ87548.1 GGDEF domain-containing protein [Floricoccus penangensis]